MRQRYTIVIERAPANYAAYAPDVPGCVTTGKTPEETARTMAEALAFHFEGMLEDGDAIPVGYTQPADVTQQAPDDEVTVIEMDIPEPASAVR
jgi:predicted RNase H-like HicB family nuclease